MTRALHVDCAWMAIYPRKILDPALQPKESGNIVKKDTEMEFDMCLYVLIIIQKANWV